MTIPPEDRMRMQIAGQADRLAHLNARLFDLETRLNALEEWKDDILESWGKALNAEGDSKARLWITGLETRLNALAEALEPRLEKTD
jgi:hypothetical protein